MMMVDGNFLISFRLPFKGWFNTLKLTNKLSTETVLD